MISLRVHTTALKIDYKSAFYNALLRSKLERWGVEQIGRLDETRNAQKM
jgi:hypothetical protein